MAAGAEGCCPQQESITCWAPRFDHVTHAPLCPPLQVAASWKKPTSHPEDIVAVYVAPVSATFDVVQFIKAKKAVELQGSAT